MVKNEPRGLNRNYYNLDRVILTSWDTGGALGNK